MPGVKAFPSRRRRRYANNCLVKLQPILSPVCLKSRAPLCVGRETAKNTTRLEKSSGIAASVMIVAITLQSDAGPTSRKRTTEMATGFSNDDMN